MGMSSVGWRPCVVLCFLLMAAEARAAEPDTTAPTPPSEAAQPSPEGLPAAATEASPPVPASSLQLAAEQRRQRGLRFWDLQNFRAARDEFVAAYDLAPRPLFLYNAAVTSMALGDSASAYAYFARYLREAGDKVPPERRLMVEGQLVDLADHVATLAIHVDEQGAQVFVDGERASISPVVLNAGSHTVTVRRRSGQSETRSLTLSGGQRARADFDFLAREQARAAAAERTRWLIVGWSSTALLATGAALSGLKALDAHQDYQETFEAIGTSRKELDELDARATRWSVTADVLTVGAVVAGGFSLYLTFKRPAAASAAAATSRRSLDLRLSAGAASVRGTF